MKIASVADVKAHFSAYLRSAVRGPVVVTRGGRPAGVLLAIEDEEELERLVLAYSPRLRALLDAARQRLRAWAGIPPEDFWAEVESRAKSRRRTGPRTKTAGAPGHALHIASPQGYRLTSSAQRIRGSSPVAEFE